MKKGKTIRQTAEYRDFTYEFEGMPITFRHYFKQNAIHIRIDDNFAKANGYNSLAEIHKISPLLKTVEWIDAKMFEQGLIAAVMGEANPAIPNNQFVN